MTDPMAVPIPTTAPHADSAEKAGELSSDMLVTYFQPFYNLQTGRMQGLEALARLRQPHGPPESPAAFFAHARATGQMRCIDLQVLDDALAHVARWHEQAQHADFIVSVNLSAELVGHPELVGDITAALAHHGLAADRLLVDIPTADFRRLIAGAVGALDRLRLLQKRSVTFCLDGFTADDLDIMSAAALVPVDIIKLDPQQVASASFDEHRLRNLARAVQHFGFPVVAAGVETLEQLDLVRELGFEWVQGFLLGEPVAGDRALAYPTVLDR